VLTIVVVVELVEVVVVLLLLLLNVGWAQNGVDVVVAAGGGCKVGGGIGANSLAGSKSGS